VREGFIPAYRFGRRLRFPKDEFEAWVEAQRADRVHTIREDKETEPVQEGSDGTYLLGSLERR
jgi:hypothetical protein